MVAGARVEGLPIAFVIAQITKRISFSDEANFAKSAFWSFSYLHAEIAARSGRSCTRACVCVRFYS